MVKEEKLTMEPVNASGRSKWRLRTTERFEEQRPGPDRAGAAMPEVKMGEQALQSGGHSIIAHQGGL
ncbi:hypothetical protein ACLMNJ_04195 [Streptomyces seoulensis]